MIRTVETRWFFRAPPFPAPALFPEPRPPKARVDWYALPCDERWGVKLRESRLEMKLRDRELGIERFGAAAGRVEEWTKWSVAFGREDAPQERVLGSAGWVAVEKRRLLRMFVVEDGAVRESKDFETRWPASGCQLEWTELGVRGTTWWTVGLEAFGPDGGLVEILRAAARHVLAPDAVAAALVESASYGYPRWLCRLEEGRGKAS